jgi:hypothetical protein
MACAPRPNNKAKKIAYSVLGVPMNLQKRNWKKDQRVENRLVFEEVTRVR